MSPPADHGSDVAGKVIGLFGPTGVGKTPVAVRVARALGTRVISSDSIQLYRGLPLLSNQPTAEELAEAPHALVAEVDPRHEWSAALYAERARGLIDADMSAHGWAVLAGGTGLYMRAALAPLDIPDVHEPGLRAHLQERGREEGPEVLHAELAALDWEAASRIHPRNLRRVVRALEVALVLGPNAWSGRSDLWRPAYRHPTILVGLVLERSQLYERIDCRARQMVTAGAVEEVKRLLARGEPLPGAAKAIGFRELGCYLEGRCTLEAATEKLAAASRRYARRQLTWMRKMRDVVIIDASRGADAAAKEVLSLAGARAKTEGE